MSINRRYLLMTEAESKAAIHSFMRENYTDERLAWLLAHAEEGKLAYMSCCCFIGIVTADHALRGYSIWGAGGNTHYHKALVLPGAREADVAFALLGKGYNGDAARRRILIPMIRAEMRRRSRVTSPDAIVELKESR